MPKSKLPSFWRVPRSYAPAASKSVRDYATRTGEVIWAWNRLHYVLGFLFVDLVIPSDMAAGNAIWQSIRSDGGQRDALRAAVELLDNKPVAPLQALRWFLKTVGRLAPLRNDATHQPTQLNLTERAYVTATAFAAPAGAKRLTSHGNLRQFHRLLRDDIYALINYTSAIFAELKDPGKYGAFPQPPKLRSISAPAFPLPKKPRRSL